MLVSLLIMLLSEPNDPIIFGVVREFKSQSECIQFLAKSEAPEEVKSKMRCLAVVKPVEV